MAWLQMCGNPMDLFTVPKPTFVSHKPVYNSIMKLYVQRKLH